MEYLGKKAEQFSVNSSVWNANMLLLIIQEKASLPRGEEVEREKVEEVWSRQ